ncbi:transglycosylase SLT domain-containing protein [Candidatus Nitrospira neomarina]|uniref:Transglycosylase SLT domain-containing protein n=1 Tax=Candidatus Nitrospira neomarina TaxID=3020899 RepID=A0AA96GLW8_9BACT|nr:transglycosylase SLT domain-containing protein [Candidatus Nitrospira neomarina]WNM61548.1 transglycosylase SLT domain-containing protein [Candidatus Nitrospira neomarina]
MKILSIHLLVGVFVGGCILFLPQTVVSLDPPSAPCQNSDGCVARFLEQLESSGTGPGARLDHAKFFNEFVAANDNSALAKHAGIRYGYWLKESSPLEAITLLQTSLHDFPILRDYLTFWIGQAYVHAGLGKEAAEAFQQFSEHFSDSLLRADALYAGGDVLANLGDCEAALSMWSQALSIKSDHPKSANAFFQMGLCFAQMGERERAVEIFRELWWKFPLAPERVQAESWLRREVGSLFLPSLDERYKRSMALYNGGALEEAVQEFQHITSLSPPTPQLFQVQYTMAMALVRLKRYDQAEGILTSLSRSSSPRRDDAWVWLGRVYLRQGKGPELEALVGALATEKVTGDQQSLLLTFYGIWLEDHARWLEAGKAYKRAAAVAHTLTQRLDALWRVGWIHYQQKQFLEAMEMFQEIIQAVGTPQTDSSLHAASQAFYWLARAQERLGQMEPARERLKNLSQDYPFTYYGQLADIRLGPTEFSTKQWAVLASTDIMNVETSAHLQQDIHYQKTLELQTLRLYKEAVKELEVVFTRFGADPKAFPQLVSLASEIGAYDVGIRLSIRHFGGTLRKGQLHSSSAAWLGAFPMGYQSVIQSFAPKHVDPFLVAGLIREESLYSARVVSPVGAIGLMQLMPETAKKVGRQLGLQDSDSDRKGLNEPNRNIQLGTYYLGQLLNEFQGNIIYAVAAYNAGPQAVKRWVGQNGHRDPDEFIELIGYRETRGYVKRVLGSYRIYRTLFGDACRGVSLDRFC